MEKKRIYPENKYLHCQNLKDGYCKLKSHYITNGFASKCHCSDCEDFVEDEKNNSN